MFDKFCRNKPIAGAHVLQTCFIHLGLAYAPIVETSFTELAVSVLDFSP